MANEDRLASLRAKAQTAIKPDVETEPMLRKLLDNAYAPIFAAANDINTEMNKLSPEYGAMLVHIQTDLIGRSWSGRLLLLKSQSVYREMVLTLNPHEAKLVRTSTQTSPETVVAAFHPETVHLGVDALFHQAEDFFGSA